jgi:ankyrin repeat protein
VICERLITAKAEINEVDNKKRTPLLISARHNTSTDIIKLLIDIGAKTDIADLEGNTPLHFAAIGGKLDVGSYLISVGTNPYTRNRKGFVPYELAAEEHRTFF